MFLLEVHDAQSDPYSLRFESAPVTLGRDASMDVVLKDPTVSRQSAVIILRDDRLYLQDLGGRNALRVNGRQVVSHSLVHGDVLAFGKVIVIFRTQTESPEGSASDSDVVVVTPKSLGEWQESDESLRPLSDSVLTLRSAIPSDKLLDILRGFADLIQRLPNREKLFEAALSPVFDFLDVRRSFIGLFGEDGILEIQAERNESSVASEGFSRTIVDRVHREAVGILFGDDPTTLSRQDSRSQVRLKIKSAMCVPIFLEDRVRGVLYIDNRGSDRSFTKGDLHFATILAHLISLALEKEELYRRIHEENLSLKSRLRRKHRIVGVSSAVRELRRKIRRVAAFDSTVLLQGESGTGKELVARAIHESSARKEQPFVAVNCAAIPEALLESELFGYVPHSGISGANPRGKPGKFELAHEGTLFLDEIGDMSLSTQAKILRVLEERVVDRLGGQETIAVDIRIVAATNKNLDEEAANGRFREDLLYRLKVLKIDLPPLRERTEDILPVAHYFLGTLRGQDPSGDKSDQVTISPRAQEYLLSYRWPGNIRELRNVVEEALLMGNGRIIYPEHLPNEVCREENRRVFGSLAEIEAQHLHKVLKGVNWNKRRAAEILGINRSTLYEKIRVYGLEKSADSTVATGAAPPRPS